MFMFFLFFALSPMSLGNLTSTQGLRWETACGQLQVSSRSEFTEHQAHTSRCLLAISRLHWDPKLPKRAVPKPGYAVSAPAQAGQLLITDLLNALECIPIGIATFHIKHCHSLIRWLPSLVLQGPALSPSLSFKLPLHVPQCPVAPTGALLIGDRQCPPLASPTSGDGWGLCFFCLGSVLALMVPERLAGD